VDPMALASELSTLGLVPVLLWMHIRSESRQDRQESKIEEEGQRKEADARFEALAKGWQRQLDAMTEKQEAREADIRDRWTAIVEKLETQKAEQSDKILEDLKALSSRLEEMGRFLARPMGR
jgi:hypothetical protein